MIGKIGVIRPQTLAWSNRSESGRGRLLNPLWFPVGSVLAIRPWTVTRAPGSHGSSRLAVFVEELSFRIRTATPEDATSVRAIASSTLSHPEGKGRREGYRAAIQRGELLVLERYDSRSRDWRISAFAEFHIRVDDILTIRDIGTEGDAPHSGMIKQLISELIRSLSPLEVGLKVRADAEAWNEVLRSVSGFGLEGSEYRRPHWINVWKWSRESAALAARTQRAPRFRR
jgi:hypothetical protein